jgi:hypothetical protein
MAQASAVKKIADRMKALVNQERGRTYNAQEAPPQKSPDGSAHPLQDQDLERVQAETRILRRDPDGFTIAVPLTEFAAKWWGEGTWWDIAERDDRYFSQSYEAFHNRMNAVVTLPDGVFLFQVSKNTCRIKNVKNDTVRAGEVWSYWTQLEPLISHAIEFDGLMLEYVPPEFRSLELCRSAVQKQGAALQFVPNELRTPEICEMGVRQSGYALRYIPEELRTVELCEIAVQTYGKALWEIPADLSIEPDQLFKIWETAIKSDAFALDAISRRIFDPTRITSAETKALCKAAVAQDGRILSLVPPELITEDLCTTAVTESGHNICLVPERFRSSELFELAVDSDRAGHFHFPALAHVTLRFYTGGLCDRAVRKNARSLRYVLPERRSKDLCEAAVQQNGLALRDVPWHMREPYLCQIAVTQNGEALGEVPTDYMTKEICEIAVRQNGEALRYVPEELLTPRLYELAVQQNWKVWDIVPPNVRKKISSALSLPTPEWMPDMLDSLAEAVDYAGPNAPDVRHR